MTTLSSRLGLKRHTTADRFRIQDYADNWAMLDTYPGSFVCTSTTRPTTWGAAQNGMKITETDTGLIWRWMGSAFVRQGPSGYLGAAARTTDLSTSATSAVTVVTYTASVPAGARAVQINVATPGVYSTAGITRVSILRGATVLMSFLQQGSTGSLAINQPQPMDFTIIDIPNVASVTYSLAINAEIGFGGTSTIQGNLSAPCSLSVVEL